MSRPPSLVPAACVLAAACAFLRYGVGPLTGLVTGADPAPIPSSLVMLYSTLVALGILVYVSISDAHWDAFLAPVRALFRDDVRPAGMKVLVRTAVVVGLPLSAGVWGFRSAIAPEAAPVDPPGIHFNLPNRYAAVRNPLPWTEENVREGGVLYTRNCAMCHGDAQDGEGWNARALQPKPANFRDSGTIAQLDENYLFWRIKEGGPGLPKHSIEYRSAMPVWDGVLNDEQIWRIVMFEYTNAGARPAKR